MFEASFSHVSDDFNCLVIQSLLSIFRYCLQRMISGDANDKRIKIYTRTGDKGTIILYYYIYQFLFPIKQEKLVILQVRDYQRTMLFLKHLETTTSYPHQ